MSLFDLDDFSNYGSSNYINYTVCNLNAFYSLNEPSVYIFPASALANFDF